MSKKLNVVFPMGKKPEIVFIESVHAEKDCYIFWEMDHLKLNPSWIKDCPHEQKEIFAIDSMQSKYQRLGKAFDLIVEACKSALGNENGHGDIGDIGAVLENEEVKRFMA